MGPRGAGAVDAAGDQGQATPVSLAYSALAAFAALGPLAAGFIADEFSVRTVFAMSGALTLGAGLLAMGARMRAAPG